MLKWIPVIVLLHIVVCVKGQQQDLYFKKLGSENGLSHNKVKCILQDRRGFMWFGTEDGLNRFDGTHFVTFRHQPSSSSGISGNIITDILEDEEGLLWIATEDGGLNRYDYKLPPKDQFRQFKHLPNDSNSIPVNAINSILEDSRGYLWLATSGASVLRFDKKTGSFSMKIPVGRTINDLCLDANGVIWAGREGGSILKVNPVTGSYEVQKEYENYYLKLPHVAVTALYKDSYNDIWFGSWDKAVYRYNARTKKEEVFTASNSPFSFSQDEAISFAEDSQKRLWIGGRYNGLYLYDRLRNCFYNFRHDAQREGSLADNSVNYIYNDRSGNLWIGTNAGISIYNPAQQQFRQVFLQALEKKASPTVVYDMFEDGFERVWIGTNKGIFITDSTSDIRHFPLAFNGTQLQVTKFYKDCDGRVYLGTNYSFFQLDTLTMKVVPLKDKTNDVVMRKLVESRIVSVVRDTIDGHPALVVSPYGHFLAYYDFVLQKWYSRKDSTQPVNVKYDIRDNLVRKLVRCRSGKIWMANLREGLGEWRAASRKPVRYFKNNPQSAQTISNNNIYDILEDGDNLWLSTYGGGLNYFKPSINKFIHINTSNNLLEGIQKDDDGNIWMISNGNLHKYNRYDQSNTSFLLPDLENTGGVKGYIFKTKKGRMYVAGVNFIISFHPDSIRIRKTQPSVIFTDFKIFNNSYSNLLFKDRINLRYNQNFFTFEFSAPYYSASGEVRYSYMLEGVDQDWVDAGSVNFASYSNISGGSYQFKVRATVSQGVWLPNYSTIQIEVIPPFWKRWWFFAICGLFAAGVIYSIYRYRINVLLERQAIRNKIAQDLHDNVGSTLSSISIYSQVAQIKSREQNETELNNVLAKIGVTSNEMISEMNDIVWTINPRNDNMEKIFQRMDSFAKPLLAARNILLHFEYDEALLNITLDMTKRKNFYLIFKEAITNAVKYSNCKNVWVSIHSQRNIVELLVQDDGVGFDKEKLHHKLSNSLSGNGLRNISLRAAEMNGQSQVVSQPGKGTLVSLSFPVT
ncbi:MAG TPA: two-component regulator propeller domain-containing protein [Chitinophagaceae bacterium]|nr:two-component regulator propeller domain-containing protein [Chitinophagaceae bacterium]